jgi:hypothetical protein
MSDLLSVAFCGEHFQAQQIDNGDKTSIARPIITHNFVNAGLCDFSDFTEFMLQDKFFHQLY